MLARRAVAERKAVRCRDACALTSINYGTLLQTQIKLSEAGPLLLEALQGSRATFGDPLEATPEDEDVMAQALAQIVSMLLWS